MKFIVKAEYISINGKIFKYGEVAEITALTAKKLITDGKIERIKAVKDESENAG